MSHFLSLDDLNSNALQAILANALRLKQQLHSGAGNTPSLAAKTLVMIFEKASTRTRLSFEIGMQQLGGSAVFLGASDSQLGRGESIADTARVVSRMAQLVMIRTHAHQRLVEFSDHATVPVINGLSDRFHPCQLLADMLTMQECFGTLAGLQVAWVGDGNNVCNSYIEAAKLAQFQLRIFAPTGYTPEAALLSASAPWVQLCKSKHEAVADADVVTTDVWASMGQEQQTQKLQAFNHCQVDAPLMQLAKPEAVFLHCLPAHRHEEVTNDVIEGPQSRVWQQAENRLHAQKALMEFLLL